MRFHITFKNKIHMKKIKVIFSLLVLSQTITAQNWTGAVSSDWNTSGNWSATPSNGASITINPLNYTGGAFSPIISSNSTFTVSDMQLLNGAVLTIGANLTTTDDVNVLDANSEIIVNQGTFSVNFGGNGRLIADLAGEITVNGGTVNVGQRLISGIDALITINNGSVTTNERLLMDGGGKIIVNDGVVNVGQVMALADGDVNGSSYFEQNGGVVTISGEVALENEAGNFQPTIVVNGGTFTLNGDLVWFGAAPGTGTPKFITTGGTTTINGAISNLPLSTVNMLLDIKGTSAFNFNGTSIDLINVTDSIKQAGISIFKLSGTHNWNNVGVFYASNGLVLCDGTTNLLGTGKYIFNDLTVASSKALNHTAPFEIFVNGDFSKLGSFNPASNKVTFNGTTPQSISGSSTITFASVEINNNSGVTLNNPVSVANNLILTNGALFTSSANILSLTATATASSGSAVSFVNGPMKKIGNTAFIFPIGKNGKWGRMGISAPSLVSSEMTAEYFDNTAANTTVVNSPLSAVSAFEYWNIEKSIPADNLTVELYWEDAALSGISDCAATTIARYNGASWDNVISSSSGNCTGNGSGSVISNAPQSNVGIFTFGYFGNVVSQQITLCNGESLMVGSNTYITSGNYIDVLTDVNNNDSTVITNLTVLNPIISNQTVQLCFGESITVGSSVYSTSGNYVNVLISALGCDSTVNTNLFIANQIDASTNTVGILISANNTSATSYQWLDCDNAFSPISGANSSAYLPSQNGNYAVQISEGNCQNTSACVLVNSVGIEEENEMENLSLFPNPTNGMFTLKLPNEIKSVEIEIADLFGRVLLKHIMNDVTQYEFNLTSFANGMYVVKCTTPNETKIISLIKE